jgi:hypothetical protein
MVVNAIVINAANYVVIRVVNGIANSGIGTAEAHKCCLVWRLHQQPKFFSHLGHPSLLTFPSFFKKCFSVA